MNKAETAWIEKLLEYGCCVCRQQGHENYWGRTEIHHLLRGGRRIDHLHSLSLCTGHHRAGGNTSAFVSRHPWKRAFELRYGTEFDLLKQLQDLLLPK